MIGEPRIQGSVVEIESPPEFAGQWTFKIFISIIGSGEEAEELDVAFPIFKTKDEALAELRKVTQIIVETVQVNRDGVATGDFVDLKSNKKRNYRSEE